MAVPGMTIPLPGGLNDVDEDLEEQPHKSSEGRDRKDRGESPKRQKGDPDNGVVTMSSLRSLLAEQSLSLLQAQQLQMTTALSAFEERQAGRLDKLEQRVGGQSDAMSNLENQVRDLADRLAKVENRPQGQASSGPDRKHTLVFGGWGADTRRATLLHQLDQALVGLKLKGELDSEPFTTGACRSVALCQFRRRAHEEDSEVRQRMVGIMQIINASQVNLQGGARPLWCSFSKSPEERGRAAVAAAVRKTVLRVAPHRAGDLDIEYPSGRSWIRDDQLSGMGAPPQEIRHHRSVTTKGGEGWIDERTLAKWLDIPLDELQGILSEHRF